MNFNHDSGSISSILTIDTTIAPPLGGQNSLQIIGTGALAIPSGTTAQRPVAAITGMQRYNTDTSAVETYDGAAWSTDQGGTVTSVALASGNAGITVSGGPVTSSGTITVTLDPQLLNLVNSVATDGAVTRLSDNTYVQRSMVGTAPVIVTNGDGQAGNPTFSVNGELTALSTLSTTGSVTRTATGTYATRSLVGAGSIVVTDGDGVAGNPTISYTPAAELGGLAALGTAGVVVRTGAATYTGRTIVGSGSIVVTNGDGVAGNPTISYTAGANLGGLEALNGTGFIAQTGAATFVERSITGTAGQVDVANGDGVAGAPTISLPNVGTPVTSAFIKVTTDAQGRVSGTTAVVGSDVTGVLGYTPVNKAGDTMSGVLDMGGNVVSNVGTPIAGADAVTKNYVDQMSTGLSWKLSVRTATTGDIALTGLQTLDGVSVAAADRVLVRAQTVATENGIYVASAGAWARATDLDAPNESRAATMFVEEGTTLANTAWTQTTEVVVIGTDAMSFTQFAGAGSYSAGTGLTLTGNSFALSSPVSTALGGTGLSSIGSANQVTGVNAAGSALEYKTVQAGAGASVTQGVGTITVANTGVLSTLAGAGISVSSATGDVTIANTGVLSVVASGAGISAATVAGAVTVTNTGITSAVAGTGVSISGGGVGAVTFDNTGVVTLVGTTNQVAVANTGTDYTVSLPADVTVANSVTVTALGANKALVSGPAGLVSGVALSNGQILIGSSGAAPVAATLTAGSGVTINNTAGGIEITASGTGGTVTSVGAVTTSGGLTIANSPVTTSGNISLELDAGLNSLAALATTGIVVASAANTFVTRSLVAGTGVSITGDLTSGDLTIANTGVTSVGLTLPSIFDVTGSPVTTTGTLAATLASQQANFVFAGPTSGGNATPAFRKLVPADVGLELYKENGVAAVAPVASGANAVAFGSGAKASGAGAVAFGAGSDASIDGSTVKASGSFATAGDAQSIELVLRGTTSDATPGELFIDGAALRAALPDNSAWTFTVQVVGRRTDANGGAAGYRFDGIITKDAVSASTAFIGTPSKNILGETQAAWDAAVAADTTNGALKVTVTGEASKAVRWVATVRATQVTN